MKSIIEELRTKSDVFHACPFVGELKVSNLEMKDESFFSIYSAGVYRSVAEMADKTHTFLNVTVGTTVQPPSQARRG